MTASDPFKTETMARILQKQGKSAEAAEIYRFLVDQKPHREDLRVTLARLEKLSSGISPQHLVELFSTWLDLLFLERRLDKLNQLKEQLKAG